MAVAHAQIRPAGIGDATARTLGVLGCATLIAFAIVAALYLHPPPWTVVAAALGLLAVLALAAARLDAAVLLGFTTLGIVSFEPAPPDAVFAVVIAVALVTGRFAVGRVPLWVGALLAALLALNVISSVEVLDVGRAATFLFITAYLAVFAVWLTGYVDTSDRARLVVGAYIAGAAMVAALGLLALFTTFPGVEFFEGVGYRAKSSFKDPNVFGHFLVPAALILLDEVISPRLFRGRLVKLILLAGTALGVLFSYSRSAWISAAVGTAVLLTVRALRRGGARSALLLVMLALLVGGVLTGIVALTGSIGSIEERAQLQQYDTERFAAQHAGVRLVEEYPFGIGPGQFEQVSAVSAHSTYVRALAEQGVLGLIVVFALMLTTLVLAARNVVLGRHTYGMGSGPLLAAWAGIMVSSLVIDTIHWRHLWLVAALIWAGSMRPAARSAY